MLSALDFSRTRLSLSRPITDYAKVRLLIGRVRRNAAWQVNATLRDKQYLDIGCGPNVHPAFVCLDWQWFPGIDLVWDVTRGLPLPNEHLLGVFTEHMLEHIPIVRAAAVLKEIHRVVKPNGNIRIVVPNLETYVRHYLDGLRMPYDDDDRVRFAPACPVYTPAMSINRIMHEHGHRFIYDFRTLEQLLDSAGFREIREVSFRQGRDKVLAMRDTPFREVESLYVEAVR